jgi:hypothetical protein
MKTLRLIIIFSRFAAWHSHNRVGCPLADGPGHRQFRLNPRRAQRINVFLQVFASSRHTAIESQIPASGSQKVPSGYPARCGRNVWRGFRQSIPSSDYPQRYPYC